MSKARPGGPQKQQAAKQQAAKKQAAKQKVTVRTAPYDIVEAEFVAAAAAVDQLPPPLGVELAFAGRSNVGKSSLMNTLMSRRRLVRTSSTPGCTRQINFFSAQSRDGALLYLVDLPGYGYAKRSRSERAEWARLIEDYLRSRDHLRAVVLLVDARRGVGQEEEQLLDFVAQRPGGSKPQCILVATKIDKIPRSKRKAALAALATKQKTSGSKHKILGLSAETGDGVPELWTALRKAALT